MRYWGLTTATMSMLCLSVPATAQALGTWRIAGDITGKSFVVDCQFSQPGNRLGGRCTEVASGDKKSKPGKQHIISKGNVEGRAIRWTYPTKVMMMSIDIDFTGTLDGDAMHGTVSAKGRQGTFSARKL